jgi:DNA-binding transcriptional regulator YhcF (GntR family)
MTDEYAARTRDWVDLVRRTQLGRSTKAVAFLVAHFADSDGTRVFPGIARIAVEAEIGYKTAQKALDGLRRAGLIERVQRTGKPGAADEYRLVVSPDLQDKVEVLSPSQITKAIEAMRRPWGGKKAGPQPPEGPEVEGVPQPPERAEVEGFEGGTSAPWASISGGTSAPWATGPQPPQGVRTSHYLVTTPTAHSDDDLSTAVTVVAREAVDEDPIDSLPVKCSHGLTARLLPNGTSSCALCRREARAASSPNVIPFRRPA